MPAFLVALACGDPPAPTSEYAALPAADRIFLGGPIFTVDAEDRIVDALAIRDGRIVAVGSEPTVLAHRGPGTRVTDLDGGGLLPGFFDSHGHITQVAALSSAENLAPPPAGDVTSITAIQSALRARIERDATPPGVWVLGRGYDDSLLDEQRSPTRDDLDAVSTEHPIVILHVSLHLAVANGAALARAGVDASTADPPGGVYRRRPGSREPNGVLEEHAMYAVLGALPVPDLETRLAGLDAAQARYAAVGVTTAQDGATGIADFAVLRAAAERGRLFVDVVSYPVWMQADAILAEAGGVGAERVPVRQAIRALTIDGAWQAFAEHEKGSLEPGKRADLVILSDDPLSVPPDRLADLRVVETIKDGRTIHPRTATAPPAAGDAEGTRAARLPQSAQ